MIKNVPNTNAISGTIEFNILNRVCLIEYEKRVFSNILFIEYTQLHSKWKHLLAISGKKWTQRENSVSSITKNETKQTNNHVTKYFTVKRFNRSVYFV